MKPDDLPGEIGHAVQRALRPLMNPLLEAIGDLHRSMQERHFPVQLSQSEIETMFQELRSNTTATAGDGRPAKKDSGQGKPARAVRNGTEGTKG
jgi:hypothetical protein